MPEIRSAVSPYCYPGIKKHPNFIEKVKADNTTYRAYLENKLLILDIIAKECGISADYIQSKCRKREYTDARHIYCATIKLKYGITLKEIGQDLNNRDHTSIRHAILKFSHRYKNEERYKCVCDKIFTYLGIEYCGQKILGGKYK